MQARRASRELALILFSQLDKNIDKYKEEDFASIVLKSVRTLISSSAEEVSLCTSQLADIKNEIIEYEKIRNYLIFLKEEIKNNYTENNATKIIAKLKHKKENPITKLVFQPFRYLFHELLRFQ